MSDNSWERQVFVLTGTVPWTEKVELLGVYSTYEAATAAYKRGRL